MNLRETHGALPCGRIEDALRFGWRGQHLDCARHFYTVETILRLLDLMALVKLNRFHWHFADDETFRLEVDSFPDLWRKTSFRGEGELVPGVFGGGIRAGGSYSKADVAEILARAEELHIEILLEIEIPAHAFAFNKAVPGLRDRGDNGPELSVQGYGENILNPALPKTFEVVTPLMLEVAGMFHGSLLFSWTGQGPGIEAAREGYDVVMCPAQNIYFDQAHSNDPDDWGATWATILPLEQVVNWQPVPKGAEDVAQRIVGIEGCFWSEFTCEDVEMEPMLAPRILGLATKAWDRADSVDGPMLRALAGAYAPLFDRIGWRRHKGA